MIQFYNSFLCVYSMEGWCVDAGSCVQARKEFGSPCYLYSEDAIRKQAKLVLEGVDAPFGLTVRFVVHLSVE